ncbi:hypothetical protein CBER1_03664 [Cercospora berteroae]|uniref:Uncharacterized protein n=1 Tax=Cercospora berteroae TaxID=357750 RepID=A0A2S6CLN1_9PEZI|nr:hypothetical protein CBER1_03664 [Cercospora berteroae]
MESSPLMPQGAVHDCISPATSQQGVPDRQKEARLSSKDMATESIRSTSDALSTREGDRKDRTEDARKLQRFPLTFWLTVTYAILSIFAWAINCTLVRKPLNASHYGLYLRDGDVYGYRYPTHSTYMFNERILQVARVVQAIVAVSAVPLTSAVCSTAAVTFMQREHRSHNLSLRKTMVLADKGWADFEVYLHLLRGRLNSYGSSLLYLAILLIALGASLSPLQSVFLTSKTVQTPVSLASLGKITDLIDIFDEGSFYSQLAPVELRSPFANYSSTWGSGYVNGSLAFRSWAVVACMPTDQSKSLWNRTRNRQTISEQLYLNLTAFSPNPYRQRWSEDQWSGLFKITLNTTTGYFELPNIMNGGLPGRLLENGPEIHCGRDCVLQSDLRGEEIYDRNNTLRIRQESQESNGTYMVDDGAFALFDVKNKGPLLTIALALFGTGSWIADRAQHPDLYVNLNVTSRAFPCTERVPFAGLLASINADSATIARDYGNMVGCVSNNNMHFDFLRENIFDYVQMHIGPKTGKDGRGPTYEAKLNNAWEAAAFLANERWLKSGQRATLTVNYDPGAPIQTPHISTPGMICISVLLSIYLVSLLAMAVYGNWNPHWTSRLDAFTMMQLGAAISEYLPLQLANNTRIIRILDEVPGWVGDSSEQPEDDAAVGRIGLGASGTLRAGKRYKCYTSND